MPVEIERKYLVKGDSWRSGESLLYRQGYLSSSEGVTVRIRTAGDRGYLTIKGQSRGLTRDEFEYEIPWDEAQQILDTLCGELLVEKRRYRIEHAGHVWEVDEFLGANEGLVDRDIRRQFRGRRKLVADDAAVLGVADRLGGFVARQQINVLCGETAFQIILFLPSLNRAFEGLKIWICL